MLKVFQRAADSTQVFSKHRLCSHVPATQWLLRRTPTWAVGLLAQEEREASDLVLSPGCGQRGGQRRVVGVGRQLEGLPLELHQRLITSSWEKEKKKTFSHASGSVNPTNTSRVLKKRCRYASVSRRWGGGCDWAVFVKTTTKCCSCCHGDSSSK